MQTLLGFWSFELASVYAGRSYVQSFADDGFGTLIVSPCPVHAIAHAFDYQ